MVLSPSLSSSSVYLRQGRCLKKTTTTQSPYRHREGFPREDVHVVLYRESVDWDVEYGGCGEGGEEGVAAAEGHGCSAVGGACCCSRKANLLQGSAF
jgi:hypothetical protein